MGVPKLPVVKATDLLDLSEQEIFEFPHDVFELVFLDGSHITTRERTAFSWVLWDVHRAYPNTPLLVRHHIGDAIITPKTHVKILTHIKNDCLATYDPMNTGSMFSINELIHKTFNRLYNVLTVRLEAYVSGANALDVLEIISHPVVAAANNAIFAQPDIDAKFIAEQHDIIASVLEKDESVKENSVAIAYRNGLVKGAQLLQCISSRGFMSEINNRNFKVPMLHSYSTGMRTLTNYACDSRMATISALMQETVMRDLQYANRSFQILNDDIRNVYYVDCGTMEGEKIIIDSAAKLAQYTGMYRMQNNKWVMIDTKDLSLLNQPITLRTMVNCKHPDRHGVCIKCIGELASGIVPTDKIGQFIAGHLQQKNSQNGLSVKHFSANAFDVEYELNDLATNYFYLDEEDGSNIYLKEEVVKNNGILVFNGDEIKEIVNLQPLVEKGEDFAPSRHSSVTSVTVSTDDGTIKENVGVDIGSVTNAYLSQEAVYYILKDSITVNERGDWVVDLKEWDIEEPIFRLPRQKVDTVQASKRFEAFLKGLRKRNNDAKGFYTTDYDNFGEAIMGLQALSIDYSPTPVTHLQMMLYGVMANNPDEFDYRLPDPKNRQVGKFVTFNDKVGYGNLAVAMAYEKQGSILLQPTSYNLTKRSPSEYEWFVLKGELLQ